MRKTILIALLLLAPIAQATIILPLTIQGAKQTVTYDNKNTETYTWLLTNPPFNLTSGVFINDSLSRVLIDTQFLKDTEIDGTRTYTVEIGYNSSHSYRMDFQYEKHGWGIFAYYNNRYVLYKDNAIFCQDSTLTITPNLRPSPHFIFDFGIHGSTNSVGNPLIQNHPINVSGEVLYVNPSLFLTWSDEIGGPLDFFSNTFSNPFSDSPCPAHTIGGQVYGDEYEMTSAPTLAMYVSDNSLTTHKITYQFDNRTVSIANINATITGINNALQGCIGPSIFGLCIVEFLGNIITTIFKIATLPIASILSVIPGFNEIALFAKVAFQTFADFTRLMLQFSIDSTPNYPVFGILITFIVWNTCLGLLLFSFTLNPWHILAVPYFFSKAYVYIVIGCIFGPIWLAIKMYQIIAEAIP